MRLAIKLNNTSYHEPCAVCGDIWQAPIGPALFLDGSWSAVCYDCGIEHEPTLVAVLEIVHRYTYLGEMPEEIVRNLLKKAMKPSSSRSSGERNLGSLLIDSGPKTEM